MKPNPWPWLVLPVRLVSFAAFQAVFFAVLGNWQASTAWWPLAAALGNLVTILLLVWLFRREDARYAALFRLESKHLGRDLLVMLGVIVVAAPLVFLPQVLVADWLFGGPGAPLALLIQPLPHWGALLALAFPATIVFAELPLYFGYAMPRIEKATGSLWLAVSLPALFLALQHVALPLAFEWRFALWRSLMYLPFALWLGAVLRWRPSLMPYLVVLHGLLDLSVVALFLQAAR